VNTIEKIQAAIEALPENEYRRLVEWVWAREEEIWDNQIVQDSQSGKLDFLIEEAQIEKRAGKCASTE
jgi:hypothetical protein